MNRWSREAQRRLGSRRTKRARRTPADEFLRVDWIYEEWDWVVWAEASGDSRLKLAVEGAGGQRLAVLAVQGQARTAGGRMDGLVIAESRRPQRYADECVPRRHAGERKLPVQLCCTGDGGRPSAAAVQAEAANHLLLLHLRGVVVSELGKGQA